MDSLYKLDSLAIHIAENNNQIRQFINEKIKLNAKRNINHKCYPTTNDNVKIVSFEWRGKIYRDSISVSYIRAVVDLNSKKVIEVEKTEKEGSNFMFW